MTMTKESPTVTALVGITADIEMIGPPEATTMLLESDVQNRSVRTRVVNGYADEMRSGKWLVTGESIKIDRQGGLIDGQHRLRAIIDAGVTLPILVVRGLDRSVIRVIDTAVRRSAADSLRFAGFTYPNMMAVSSVARLAVARDSGGLATYGKVQKAVSHLAIIDWVTEHPDVNDSVRFGYAHFGKLGIVPSPLAYAHWKLSTIDPLEAIAFFEGLTALQTTGADDPRYVLFRAFAEERYRVNPGVIIGRTFTAWNAWRDSQVIKRLPVEDSNGAPLKIPDPI